MRVAGLIGHELKHSISPVFQQAAFDHLGLDVRYELWDTPPDKLSETVGILARADRLGANVTIPYKEAVLPLMHDLDRDAARIGAVNTIVNRDGSLVGYNTDSAGFLRALYQDASFVPRGKTAVLLGAGGVARAAAFTLIDAGICRLTIVNRTPERAEALAASLKASGTPVAALPFTSADLRTELVNSNLIVNCTSVGLKDSATEGQSPLKANQIPGRALVYDLVYNPLETPLMKEAEKAGARTLGGLAMLIYQGAISFRLWTGIEAPLQIMADSARKALE
ncbi:MAG: shikimate dehydrogenase [Dehalococcoidia bacterium]|nr:shikimate dehydrogenase [Dehalococcoidia bacterium]